MSTTQISAYISEETKTQVEIYAKRRGLKKAFLIEEALLHHLQALREIPDDVMIPARLVLSEESMKRVAERLQNPKKTTKELTDLLRA